jgi:hypothetical protein
MSHLFKEVNWKIRESHEGKVCACGMCSAFVDASRKLKEFYFSSARNEKQMLCAFGMSLGGMDF